MKRLIALALVFVCVLGLAACSQDQTVRIQFPFEMEDI